MASLLTGVLGSNKERSINEGSRRWRDPLRGTWVPLIAMAVVSSSCSRRSDDKPPLDAAMVPGSATPFQSGAPRSPRDADAETLTGHRDGEVDRAPNDPPFPLDAGKLVLKLDKPIDLGPPGAMVATPIGALFRTH